MRFTIEENWRSKESKGRQKGNGKAGRNTTSQGISYHSAGDQKGAGKRNTTLPTGRSKGWGGSSISEEGGVHSERKCKMALRPNI